MLDLRHAGKRIFRCSTVDVYKRKEYAEEVIQYARAQREDDIAVRSRHYENLGYESDSTLERLKE